MHQPSSPTRAKHTALFRLACLFQRSPGSMQWAWWSHFTEEKAELTHQEGTSLLGNPSLTPLLVHGKNIADTVGKKGKRKECTEFRKPANSSRTGSSHGQTGVHVSACDAPTVGSWHCM